MLMFLFGALFLATAGCSSDGQACSVVDACISQCATECAPESVIAIACVGNACNCSCEDGGGGAGGSGGATGAGGSGGAGGRS